MKYRLAIIVGHNSRGQGAQGVAPLSRSEFDFNTDVARAMKASGIGRIKSAIFFRTAGLGYKKEITKVYREADAFIDNRIGATIELHFNAFNRKTVGTETLTSGSTNSRAFAEECQEALVDLYARPPKGNRGVKVRGPGERGGLSLHSSRHPSILVEPFFGDARADAALAVHIGIEALAEAYMHAADEYFSRF